MHYLLPITPFKRLLIASSINCNKRLSIASTIQRNKHDFINNSYVYYINTSLYVIGIINNYFNFCSNDMLLYGSVANGIPAIVGNRNADDTNNPCSTSTRACPEIL